MIAGVGSDKSVHCEADATCPNAIYQWSEIMKDMEGKEDMRRWYLLAATCKRDLEQKGKGLQNKARG